MALLGHDLLMAGDAHALSAAHDEDVQFSRHHPSSDVQSRAGHATSAQEPEPDHETGLRECSSIRLLVLRVGSSPDLEATSASVPNAEAVWPVQEPLDDWWREPTAPPNMVRAMFQVYLI